MSDVPPDPEIMAIVLCVRALASLDLEARGRVIRYLGERNNGDVDVMRALIAEHEKEASDQ